MAIFFDLDGTLLEDNYTSMEETSLAWLFEEHRHMFGLSRDEFAIRWQKIQEAYFNRYCLGEITYRDYGRAQMQALFKIASVDLSDGESSRKWALYFDRFLQGLQLYPDTIPCLSPLNVNVRMAQKRIDIRCTYPQQDTGMVGVILVEARRTPWRR